VDRAAFKAEDIGRPPWWCFVPAPSRASRTQFAGRSA